MFMQPKNGPKLHEPFGAEKRALRNRHIVRLAIAGFSPREIALMVGLKAKTVSNIMCRPDCREYYRRLQEGIDKEFVRRATIVRLRRAGLI